MHPQVETYFEKLDQWKNELLFLRSIVMDCGLVEDCKWKHPAYTYNQKNVVLIHYFKDYCALMFFKGALLQDEEKLLATVKNVQAERQLRFTSIEQLNELEATIRAYIFEAIEIEKAGLKVKMKETSDYEVPEELITKFDEDPSFQEAFENLTPGRQRGYLYHFAQAKQSKTRTDRILKFEEKIRLGKGLNDCTCGLSKRMPNCDGSHKQLQNN